jgi:hypothetical protein
VPFSSGRFSFPQLACNAFPPLSVDVKQVSFQFGHSRCILLEGLRKRGSRRVCRLIAVDI